MPRKTQREEKYARENTEESDHEPVKIKRRKPQTTPSKEKRDIHECTHIPFRNWYDACLRGVGINKPHVTDKVDNSQAWLVRDADREIESWGYPRNQKNPCLTLKSDTENAILKVRNTIASTIGGRVLLEQPMAGENQSNNAVQVNGKNIRGLIRTIRIDAESKTGAKIDNHSDAFKWITKWAAMSLNKFKSGTHGKTSPQRLRLRRIKHEVVPWGEQIYYRSREEHGKLEHGSDTNASEMATRYMETQASKHHGQ